MAEFVISPVLEVVFGNLASAAMEELRLVWGVDDELQNLKSTLSAIQAVLEDAEDRQSESKAVKDWLEKLQDVAYDADDLVDDMATEAEQSIMENKTEFGRKKMKQQVCNFLPSCFSCSSRVGFRREMAHGVKKINERLGKIAREKAELHLQTRFASKQFEVREGRRQLVGSVRHESEVFGRQKDEEEIIESLLFDDSSNRRKISVIAIVGMGGQGKTTLAQQVYNDERVTSKFELRAWVCVSEDFDVIRLTKEIIESASGSTCDLLSIDALQRRLHEILNGKRFLLVLDDVWNENFSYWDQLRGPFASGEKGSKIMVTTRSKAVSGVLQPTYTHNLEGLSKEDCWALFKSRAFVDDDKDNVNADYPRLVEIGMKLMDKCQGLPLAAKALGGLLSSTRDEREWENVLKSKTWELHGAGGEILPALRLSYQHLPTHLKRCFTFCSVYKKDYQFKQQKLVQMWIAHGFVRGKDGEQIEDTGSRYFNDLVERSFFQHSHSRGRYIMHDIFHDLAQSISGNECFNAKDSEQWHRIPRKARHLSLKLSGSATFESICQLRGLRTLLFQGNCKWTNEMFNSLKFLRVLELKGYDMPNFIGSLMHLRFLKFANDTIKELPESLCSIYNLQTLILSDCDQLIKLPCEMSKLINLRHLELKHCPSLESMPPGIGRLTRLQTLSTFIVSREEERGVEELKNLTDLRGSLEITNLGQVEKVEAAQQADLKSKRFIDKLQLIWSNREPASSINETLEEEVAEELQPHPNVKKLRFRGYMGTHFPSWMMKRWIDMLLPNLTEVHLDGCRRCNILPPLGQLPFLVSLVISNMNEVKYIAEGWFPRLKHLRIKNCPQLTSLPRFSSLEKLLLIGLDNLEDWCGVGEADFQNLKTLSVRKCPQLSKWPTNLSSLLDLVVSDSWGLDPFPFIPSLRYLEIGECSDKLWNSISSFTSLSTLTLTSPRLTAVPRGILQTLKQLKNLRIEGCDKLETLLEEDDVPPTLNHLVFLECRYLKSLPRRLQVLTPLQHLSIYYCPEVASLPEEGLPTELQSFIIWGCPKLEKRCRKDMGEDWLKISRIPHLQVGYPED